MENEFFLERVNPTLKGKFEAIGLDVVETPEHVDGSTYFDASGFDGLGYSQFKKKFFDMAKDMSSYNLMIILIPLEAVSHSFQISFQAMNVWANISKTQHH